MKKLRFKNDSKFIYLPKVLEIYYSDYNQTSYFNILRYIEEK